MKDLELRLYGLVPYNISEIQKGIQFGHAAVEYGQMVKKGRHSDEYEDWADHWKTFIILNGGTSNHTIDRYNTDIEYIGTMESNLSYLKEIGIRTAEFYEPDLNDMLSAIVFLVDERVFNKKEYPDFEEWVEKNDDTLDLEYDELYEKWTNLVGGEQNIKLRQFLSNFKLA